MSTGIRFNISHRGSFTSRIRRNKKGKKSKREKKRIRKRARREQVLTRFKDGIITLLKSNLTTGIHMSSISASLGVNDDRHIIECVEIIVNDGLAKIDGEKVYLILNQ